MFLSSRAAHACSLSSESSWYWSDDRLIEETRFIFLGKVRGAKISQGNSGYEYDYDFEVLEILKEAGSSVHRQGNQVTLKNFAPPSFHASWEKRGRAMHTKSCGILASFAVGEKYLIFFDSFHPKGYEQVDEMSENWQNDWYAGVKTAQLSKTIKKFEVSINREKLKLSGEDQKKVLKGIVKMILSSSVDSTKEFASKKNWREAFSSSYIHVQFVGAQQLRSLALLLKGHETIPVAEILISFPEDFWPAHILLKKGGKIFSLAKYAPDVLFEIACIEPVSKGSFKNQRWEDFCMRNR